jgi:uncharacterized Zn finger protein
MLRRKLIIAQKKNSYILKEEDVERLATEQSFDKGWDYYRSGAIIEPIRQGNTIRAYCEGSQYEPYRVSATMGDKGIIETDCSCPYDWGGICKHIVALLLMWIHEPEAFEVIQPVEKLLTEYTKEDLLELIQKMLEQEPELVRLIELSAPHVRSTPVDIGTYRRQISYVLRDDDSEDVADGLRIVCEAADKFLDEDDWMNSGTIYHLILSETIPQYEELYDEDGDIAIVLDECATNLGRCLEVGQPDADTRRQWLESLLEAELEDIRMGGIDLAPNAIDAVINHATGEEWKWVEQKIRQEMAKHDRWGKEALIRILASRLEMSGQEDEADRFILAEGTPEQKAFLLVERGDIDAAVEIAQQHFTGLPGLVLRFADALVEANAGSAAVAFVESMSQKGDQYHYYDWLARYHQEHGNAKAALKFQMYNFRQSPSLQNYYSLRETTQKLGNWDEARGELLNQLEKAKRTDMLLDIALEEKDAARALELLPELSGRGTYDYQHKVAQVAEAEHPREAIKIYRDLATSAINGRNRNAYKLATQYMERIHSLYHRLNMDGEWQAYISGLREEYKRFRALQDEMNEAGF